MRKALFTVAAISVLAGCANYDHYYSLDEKYLAVRQTETRRFETNDLKSILSASNLVLQDLGYTLSEAESELGVLTASKERDASNAAQIAGAIVLALFTGVAMPLDSVQQIHVSLVCTKSTTHKKSFNVRIDFSRVIFDTHGNARSEKIIDPKIYQDFFDKLSQSIFLTAHDI